MNVSGLSDSDDGEVEVNQENDTPALEQLQANNANIVSDAALLDQKRLAKAMAMLVPIP